MVRRLEAFAHDHDDDSLSDEIDDVSLEYAEPKHVAKKPRPQDDPWVVKYQPQTVLKVSINPKKAREVRDIFVPMAENQSQCRLLILSGPSGSSKSTLAKCLAQETLGKTVPYSLGHVEYLDSSLDNVSQAHHFQEFMDGCRYLVGRNRCAVLIEDLPNVFHEETLTSLRHCLRDWIYTDPNTELPPVVLCLTEVEIIGDHGQRGFYNIDNCLTVETVLGRDLLNSGLASGLIRRVKFLPVAKTYIKKLLQGILASERILAGKMKHASDALTVLYESGDIRSLISNLEFMSRSSHGFQVSELMRESQITLFHAVGKVIHSSSKTRGETSNGEYSLDYESVKNVVDNYHNLGLLHLALLENYPIYNGLEFGLLLAANIVDSLSLNDTFSSPEAAHDFAIRATRNELGKVPVKSSRTLPMKFPRHFKLVKEENKVRREIGNYVRYLGGCSMLFSDVNLIDGHFLPQIKNSAKFRRTHGPKPFLYNRIGGSFRKIYADEDMPIMENEFELCTGVRDQFLEDIYATIQQQEDIQNQSGMDGESDAIEDSASDGDTDDDLDDALDEHILQMATQSMQIATQNTQRPKNPESDDDFLDDPELAILVSQGKL
ncbi:hypothetical protein METBIDRAFT_47732 [Metschnikowia bicuspidata var. bicuspidata NRRL YB-4993]|uniref:Checkpoint protein RAD24-like helical bundle domain-containing protein n=1 Tax=Metschnikowia bicuspidata var. bicuspidata NRRL YB-4993 TaxID=869754 RepID=A0A1A0H1W1_9ASCO|nr:hypothetical protein METBIDRAFT_47732 [Metschnikowia bicuspidata var. bicuspidata NRRL YB-4993]OBA18016.1 hypothetical protein METBIDRAFT_47732 [Metschnikowia bicuspidata var. bicuspidata NRRL YB-4993]